MDYGRTSMSGKRRLTQAETRRGILCQRGTNAAGFNEVLRPVVRPYAERQMSVTTDTTPPRERSNAGHPTTPDHGTDRATSEMERPLNLYERRTTMKSRISCIAAIITVLLLCASSATFAADPAQTHNRFSLNEAAYTGITFEEMYGNIIDPSKPGKGIKIGAFFNKLLANISKEAANAKNEYADSVKVVMEDITSLIAFLETPLPGNTPVLSEWPLRRLFTGDPSKLNIMVTLCAGQQVNVISVLRTHLAALEADGLTVPCNLVHQLGTYDEFQKLVSGAAFWTLLGPLDYPYFFNTSVDDASNELIETTQLAIKVGLFGMFEYYQMATDAEVNDIVKKSSSKPEAAVKLLALAGTKGCCCNQITNTCQSDGYATHVCGMCGTKCCLGSTKCPL